LPTLCWGDPKIISFFDIVENQADELILCGDIFDLWRYPYHKMLNTVKPHFKEVMFHLKQTATEVPTTIIIIPENHEEYNVIIADPFEKEDKYFCHGWNFDLMQRLGSFFYMWLVYKFPSIYQRFFKKPSQVLLPNDEP